MAAPTGNYFYPLTTGGNYKPSSNPVNHVYCGTTAASTTITVSLRDAVTLEAARVAAAARTGSTGLQVLGVLNTNDYVEVVSVNTGTGDVVVSAAADATRTNALLQYFFGGIPNSYQNPISAVLCQDNTATLAIKDGNGTTVTFASELVTGAVYYFSIGDVVTATAGAFVGIAE